jgi:hypothetical protein
MIGSQKLRNGELFHFTLSLIRMFSTTVHSQLTASGGSHACAVVRSQHQFRVAHPGRPIKPIPQPPLSAQPRVIYCASVSNLRIKFPVK